jgi:hypothetical protein
MDGVIQHTELTLSALVSILRERIALFARIRINIPSKPVKSKIIHQFLEVFKPYWLNQITIGTVVVCPGDILFCF